MNTTNTTNTNATLLGWQVLCIAPNGYEERYVAATAAEMVALREAFAGWEILTREVTR